MKAYLEIKKQPLPNYEANSFWTSIHKSAKEHGYCSFLWYTVIRLKDHFLNFWSRTMPWNGVRIRMQRWRGVSIGKHVHWGTDVTVDAPFPYFLIVEDGASFAGNNYVLTHNKPTHYMSKCMASFVAPVIIRKNVWIAVGVTILPGVEIGEGSIITAGSVVSKNIPPMVIAGGNPAKVITDISESLRDNYSKEEFDKIIKERGVRYKSFNK